MSTELATMPRPSRMTDVIDVVQHLDQLWNLADILVRSRMLPDSIRSPEAAVAIILKGRELGIGTMAAFAGITVIQGKPTVSPQLMLSLINRSGLMEDMSIEDDGRCCRVTMKRVGRLAHTASFSMDDAREMKLATKDNWQKMPQVMRQWRAVAANARVTFPDVIDGLYTPEEMGAEVSEDGEVIEARVLEPRQEEPPALPPHKSAAGLFTNEHVKVTQKFNDWVTGQCQAANARWHGEWDNRIDRALEDDLVVPSKIEDVVNPWGVKGHLLKWAAETGRLDPAIKDEAVRTRQTDAYVALVASRSDEDKAAVKAETVSYIDREWHAKTAKVYRANPDLAPAGFAEEQAEAAEPGDAYEGDLEAAGEALKN